MKRIRFSIYVGVAATLLMVALVIAAPALALPAQDYLSIVEFDKNECTPGDAAHGVLEHMRDAAETAYFSLANLSKGTSTDWGTSVFPPDGYNGFSMEVPAQTENGDKMRLTVYFEDAGNTTVAEDSLSYRCGGGAGEPYTGINLLSSAEQAPYLSVPTAEGALPCGVFDVNGHGRKYIGLADFPACTAPVTVMCLNGDGEWTAVNVSNVVMQGDYEVDFTSSQHGLCALFD